MIGCNNIMANNLIPRNRIQCNSRWWHCSFLCFHLCFSFFKPSLVGLGLLKKETRKRRILVTLASRLKMASSSPFFALILA